jgi:hypothetical protein
MPGFKPGIVLLGIPYLGMILPDLASPAKAGFAKAGNRFTPFGIMPWRQRLRRRL